MDDFFACQAYITISYQRRVNILFNPIKDAQKAKSLLKDKVTLLQKHDNHLFEKKFRAHLTEKEKSKKKTL